jgi:hypothetical protein
MLKKSDPIKIEPVEIKHELVDLIYSNSMPTRSLFKEERQVWSFAKSPEAALAWMGPRGKGKYNRLAYYDFHPDDGLLFDLTELATWIGLIATSKNGLVINNLNSNKTVEAIRSIIPCMKSAWSMARSCEEVVFIPSKRITLNVIDDVFYIPRNNTGADSVLTQIGYDRQIIDLLLAQLEGYNIRPILKNALEELKAV